MKRTLPFLAFVFFLLVLRASSQYAIAGDTTGKYVYYPPQIYYVSTSVAVGCDSADVTFVSHRGGQYYHDWSTLTFRMDSGVQVMNKGTGLISIFPKGDTIPLVDSNFTPWLDYIWGMGGMGSYGNAQIDTQYVVFRNTLNNDTQYVFLNITTGGSGIKINQIISPCSGNPFQVLGSVTEITGGSALPVLSNPFHNSLKIALDALFKATLFDLQGRVVMQWQYQKEINTSNLSCETYLLKLETLDGKSITGKVIKQ